jgi:hypothetical protein
MAVRSENTKSQTVPQGSSAPQTTPAQVRLAAAVEAAYILEARTRWRDRAIAPDRQSQPRTLALGCLG